ncbi:hypothetical protein FRX31_022556 [Thalictrum thalictroides]|uniref:Uncharacterized protein n=1 Tax=Thalictrum thalictroides TaxID=46969 RepID=A0A7J6VSZ5_THATH|nr:hypothetical protein FRX31_022556 [Thalictrum thalictroides]
MEGRTREKASKQGIHSNRVTRRFKSSYNPINKVYSLFPKQSNYSIPSTSKSQKAKSMLIFGWA